MPIYGYLLMTSDVVLILAGATMYWLSPRLRRNWVLGYGSPRSMINDATWQAANRFAGTGLALLALVMMSLQVKFWQVIEANELAQMVSVASVLALPFLVMYSTEKYLARAFRN
jgi:uncharacterized membrane protein